MIDEFARAFGKSPAKVQLPAYRYECFLSAFEKHVTRHQHLVEQARSGERVYNVVTGVMAAANLPNEQRMAFQDWGLEFEVFAIPGDRVETFDKLITDISVALSGAGLRSGSAEHLGGWFPAIKVTWYTAPLLALYIHLPAGGIEGVTCCEVERTTTQLLWSVKRVGGSNDQSDGVEIG